MTGAEAIPALIDDLEAAGVRFAIEGGEVVIDAPDGGLPAAALVPLRAHRAEVRVEVEARVGRRALLARIRPHLSAVWRKATDAELQAMVDWMLVQAFCRGGASDFRRFLARSLRSLSDDELRRLVDPAGLATWERELYAQSTPAGLDFSKGVRALTGWWLAGR